MKWIFMIAFILLGSCTYVSRTNVVEYRQAYSPYEFNYSPYETLPVYDLEPVDISTTRIEYY